MVILQIKELQLDDQTQHLKTDWQVSRTRAFNDIVLESIADSVNLRSIFFNTTLDPNVKYYARARALLSTGYTYWGDLNIFQPTAINDLADIDDLPTRIAAPSLVTNSDQESHTCTLFTIAATGYSAITTADHKATSWFIEDINGELVWKREHDDVNKTSVTVTDILLVPDQVYRIKAIFHATTGDSSQLSAYTIKIAGDNEIELNDYLDDVDFAVEQTISVGPLDGNPNFNWEILSVYNEVVESLWTATTRTNSVTIPANVLNGSTMYALRIMDSITNAWKYYFFSTIDIE